MPRILTDAHYDLLSAEARDAGDIDQRVELAEMRVVDRYREDRRGSLAWYFDGKIDPTLRVRLWGVVTDDEGRIDTAESDDELLRRLRLVIASVVEWELQRDDIEHLQREMKGQSSASYADLPALPSRLFRPLDQYDETPTVGGFW